MDTASADTGVTDNANSKTGSKTANSDSKTGAKVNKALVQGVLGRVTGTVGNEHGNDETVNGNNTSHDDGNDGLHDELGVHDTHGADAHAGLGSAVGSAKVCNTQA